MEEIFLFAAGGHTKYTIDILEQAGKYKIKGILASNYKKGEIFAEYPVLGDFEDLPALSKELYIYKGIVTIGDNFNRHKVVHHLLSLVPEFSFATAIHPSAVLGKNVVIGQGTVIMAGVIVNNDTTIGEQCFLATKASVDHDSRVDEYSSLSPGVTTGGNVSIGRMTAIGLGANILHGVSVGSNTVIGSGALVNKSVKDNVVAYGNPCKIVRERAENDKYL